MVELCSKEETESEEDKTCNLPIAFGCKTADLPFVCSVLLFAACFCKVFLSFMEDLGRVEIPALGTTGLA